MPSSVTAVINSQASVRWHSSAGACRTSMNSRKMIRTLISAIAITLNVIAVLAPSAAWPSGGPTRIGAIVIAERASHASRSRFSNRGFTGSPHHVEQGEDHHPQEVDRVPVGGAGFDEQLGAARGTPELMGDD